LAAFEKKKKISSEGEAQTNKKKGKRQLRERTKGKFHSTKYLFSDLQKLS